MSNDPEPHICTKVHGGKIIKTRDKDPEGKPVDLPNGQPSFSFSHELTPICHDCGRGLVRPRGGPADWWVCPKVHALPMQADKADHAVECGYAENTQDA